MNVTGVEWRGPDPREGRFAAGGRPRRRRSPGPDDDDVIEVHGEAAEEPADGLDVIESTEPEE
ncbi:MAG: hypothetical protein ABSH32_22805 [Bryobacteraceae bacterium]|jgi:hypothetical protein